MDSGLTLDVFVDTFPVRTSNLLKHQKTLVLQWISMFLPFRETWFLMIFLIFFVTSFGIDFRWVWAWILAPFWDPFGIKFHVVVFSDGEWYIGDFDVHGPMRIPLPLIAHGNCFDPSSLSASIAPFPNICHFASNGTQSRPARFAPARPWAPYRHC